MHSDIALAPAEAATAWQDAVHRQDWSRAAELMQPLLSSRATDIQFVFEYGSVLFHAGQYAQAYQQYLACNELRPVTGDVLNALALTAFMMQRHLLAAHWFEALLRLDPMYRDARLNLGSACFELGRNEDALHHYDAALQADSNNPQGHYNRGVVLRALNRLDDAEAAYRQAISLRPDYAEAYSNLGVVYHERGHHDRALSCYQVARTLRPDYAEAWSNAGATYMAMADYAASLAAYESALQYKPDLPSACWNKGILLLLRGDFQTGLPLYEWRFHHQRQALFRRPLNLQTPRLNAQTKLQGATVFIYDEQGLGDAIQMARYVPMIAAQGARVILRAASELHAVFRTLEGVSVLQGDFDSVPEHDIQCPMMSLPLAMETRLDSIPAQVPYLHVDERRACGMENLLTQASDNTENRSLRVGLVWAGNPRNPTDARRSLSLSRLLPALPSGPRYISLQKNASESDLALLAQRQDCVHLADHLNDFADTAALCSRLDLLLCVDTSVAHLAGALNVPVLLMISCVPDWRWMLDREDSPWYPSVQLLRQPVPGDWQTVLDRLPSLLTSHSQRQLS